MSLFSAKKFAIMGCLLATVAHAHPSSDTTDIKHVVLNDMEVRAQAGKPVYRATTTLEWEIVHIKANLQFRFAEKTALVNECITTHPWCYATDCLVLDAPGVQVKGAKVLNGNTLKYTTEGDKLIVRLGKSYRMTDTLRLVLDYVAQPYSTPVNGSKAITEDRGLYFINTEGRNPYWPKQIWTQGETEANSHWLVCIDKPNCRFTTELALVVPDSLTTLSNGTLTSQKKSAGGLRTDTWKMDKPIPAYTVMLAVGRFATTHFKWRGKPVDYYVEPAYAKDAQLYFNHTPEMMECFSKATGVPYPWSKYAQIVVRDYVSGAMENTSASLFGDFMYQDYNEWTERNNEDVVAHELFHQWFGDYVTSESWSNLTLNESFANYGEQIWKKYQYGEYAAQELAWTDLQRYINFTFLKDPQLVRYYYDNREQMFDPITYNKGGAILRYLNTLMGDDAFGRAMNIYLTQNALHSAEVSDWRKAVEAATGQDWSWFFDEWYYRPGHPELSLTYNYNDGTRQVSIEMKQMQDDTIAYRLPLQFSVWNGKEWSQQQVIVDTREQTVTFPYNGEYPPIIVPDVQHVLPGTIREYKKPVKVLAGQYGLAPDPISRIVALKGLNEVKETDTLARATILLALSDSNDMVRNNATGLLASVKRDSNRAYFQAYLHRLIADKAPNVRAATFATINKWHLPDARQMAMVGVKDNSYKVAGTALELLYATDRVAAYNESLRLLSANPKGDLDEQIWEIIGDTAAAADISLYYRHVPREQGSRRYWFSRSLAAYIKNTTSDSARASATNLLLQMCSWETLGSYRSTLYGYLFTAVSDEKDRGKKHDSNGGNAIALRHVADLKSRLSAMLDNEPDAAIKEKWMQRYRLIYE